VEKLGADADVVRFVEEQEDSIDVMEVPHSERPGDE